MAINNSSPAETFQKLEQKRVVPKLTIVMPVRNSLSTLRAVFESLWLQDIRADEIIIVDNASNDGSSEMLQQIVASPNSWGAVCRIVRHRSVTGLATSYNEAFRVAIGDIVVTIHSDVVLRPDALRLLVSPFQLQSDVEIGATTHVVDHPLDVWLTYNFWQKCLFSRLVSKKYSGLDGKFDCFNKAVIEKVGCFDAEHFATAGEDGDIVARLKSSGFQIVQTDAEIIHLHSRDESFGLDKLIYKSAQYAEAQGTLLRKGGAPGVVLFARMFFRELLVLGILIPGVNVVCLPAMLVYSIAYTWAVYKYCWRDPRILILPFLNILLLFVSSYYSLRGFITGRQRI